MVQIIPSKLNGGPDVRSLVAAKAIFVSKTEQFFAGEITIMPMLGSLAALIACQGVGNVLHVLLGVPVPGPVLGIGLLLLGLVIWSRCAGSVPAVPAADTPLSYLSLFFVPPGVAVALVVALLCFTGRPIAEYTASVQVLSLLLGPATVALAVPLQRSLPRIRQAFGRVLVGVVTGVVTTRLSAVATAIMLDSSKLLVLSISTKTAAAAIAIAAAREIGADPNLAAGMSILTGIIGAVICTGVLDLVGVRDQRALGLATRVAVQGMERRAC